MQRLTLSAVIALSLTATAVQAEDTYNIISWGGAYTESQDEAYHKPWAKEHGTKINNIDKAQTALAGLRAQVEAKNITWDLVDVVPSDAITACAEGLVEEINYDEILAAAPDGTLPSKDFIEGSLTGCFIPQIVYSNIVAYNKDMFKDGKAPKTIKDVFDLKNFPGKRSFQKKPVNILEWALVADGVEPSKVYEVLDTDEGKEQAFAKMDTIKDQVIWWEEGAQPPQLLADKEVAFASAYNGRIFNAAITEKQPFEIIWDSQVFELDGWVVPKGKLDKMKDYLKFATDTQRLADQAKYISYGPARLSSASYVSNHAKTGIDMKPHMPTYPENFKTAIPKDDEFWSDNGDELAERFNAWLAK